MRVCISFCLAAEMSTSSEVPSLDRSFSSFKELEEEKRKFEDYYYAQLSIRNAVKIETYRKRIKDGNSKYFGEGLMYQSLSLLCVKAGTYTSKSTGKRPNTSTLQSECQFKVRYNVSKDGKTLEVAKDSSDFTHNHELTKVIYDSLPRQRHLNDEQEERALTYMRLKASKPHIQQHFYESDGKLVKIQDLNNLRRKRRPNGPSDVQDLVSLMREEPGATVEVIADEDGALQAIYYQDETMQKIFSAYPTLLLMDGTYKLNNLDIPLYLLMTVDGNGSSEIVSVWFPVAEDIPTLTALMEKFKQHNPKWTEVKCVMTDKCPAERNVIKTCLPEAHNLICQFHVLNIFRREVTTKKMDISEEQRLLVLELLHKMTYARNEAQAQGLFDQIKDLNLPNVTTYIQTQWWDIREEWITGLMDQHFNLSEHCNNRVESANNKIKHLVNKHSDMVDLFRDFLQYLKSMRADRAFKARNIQLKVPLRSMQQWEAAEQYRTIVTPSAVELIMAQEKLIEKVNLQNIQDNTATVTSSTATYNVTIST